MTLKVKELFKLNFPMENTLKLIRIKLSTLCQGLLIIRINLSLLFPRLIMDFLESLLTFWKKIRKNMIKLLVALSHSQVKMLIFRRKLSLQRHLGSELHSSDEISRSSRSWRSWVHWKQSQATKQLDRWKHRQYSSSLFIFLAFEQRMERKWCFFDKQEVSLMVYMVIVKYDDG